MKCQTFWAGLALLSIPPLVGQQQADPPNEPPVSNQPQRHEIEPGEILDTQFSKVGERDVIIHKVAPLNLPPLAPKEAGAPAAMPSDQGNASSLILPTGQEEAAKEDRMIFLSATAYTFASHPHLQRCFVRYWPTAKAQPISFWTNANLLWLGGFAHLETESVRYSVMAAVSKEQRNSPTELEQAEFAMPAFENESEASLMLTEEARASAADLGPMEILLAYYTANKSLLRIHYDARQERARLAEAQRKADPPEKKTLILRYWRMDETGQSEGNSTLNSHDAQ